MKEFLKNIKDISFGQWSLTLFFIAIVSGIILIVPFNVSEPYKSITEIIIFKPYASFVRNVHYWSSQLFILFLFLHLYEYFRKKEAYRLNSAIWLRLTAGLIVIFLLLFTGFLLRGDSDAVQARQIFDNLIKEIPLIGNVTAFFILGKEGTFNLIYLNHIATFTIIVLFIIFEHSRKLFPGYLDFTVSVFIVSVLSIIFTAPLHDGINPTVKGPWYFVGLQDVLHWLTHPQWVLLIILVIITLVYFAGSKNKSVFIFSRKALIAVFAVYILLTIDGMFFRGENWNTVFPWQKDYSYRVFANNRLTPLNFNGNFEKEINNTPVINGKPESCLVCHKNVKGFSQSHSPEAIGCFSCHGGNPFSTNKDIAHKGMELVPGNLSNIDKSCGTANCHPAISERIHSSLMSNLRGMVNVDRYVFNEQSEPDGKATLYDLHHSPADEHLRNLCVRCHIGNEKPEPAPVSEESRGGGCLACHVNYDKKALKAFENHKINKTDTTRLLHHPSVDIKVTNDHCFGCHSRSGRISTNYEGWHETNLNPGDITALKDSFRLVEKTRVFKYIKDDVHHAAGLECIDCHTSYELMGDGGFYNHQEEQQDVSCSDCHTKNPLTVNAKELDEESAIIASLRFGSLKDKLFVKTAKHGKPLINVTVKNDSVILTGKNNNIKHFVKPPSAKCERDKVHENLSCSACHTAWAPTCIGCHNKYDPDEPGYNMILNKEQRGSWVEYVGENYALPPTLGVRKTGNKREIIPVIPGMILTIDVSSYDPKLHDSLIFQRLFAPAAPHTTMKKGRDCKSCHLNPAALGYGKGTLVYDISSGKGVWKFSPDFENNEHDNLPEDAWIPFLGNRKGKVSTRSNLFPFTVETQKRILTAGACLNCHDENSEVVSEMLEDYRKALQNRTSKCILPSWEK